MDSNVKQNLNLYTYSYVVDLQVCITHGVQIDIYYLYCVFDLIGQSIPNW